MYKVDLSLWSYPTHRDHDEPKLEFTLPEDPSKQLFRTKTFFRRFLKSTNKFLLNFNHLPLKACMTLHLTNLNSLNLRMLCTNFG